MLAAMYDSKSLLSNDSELLSGPEEAAVQRLIAVYRALIPDDECRVNTKTEAGYAACGQFLEEITATAEALAIPPAPRDYRANFTINYRTLFPDEARNYRVDMLEATLEQYSVIWVNGDKFEFSDEAMSLAEALHRAWSELLDIIERLGRSGPTSGKPTRQALISALCALDETWAKFEQKYIGDLIAIEDKARSLIVQAIEHEKRLRALENEGGVTAAASPEYIEVQAQLVSCVARINAVANFRRKGRDDFRADVLTDAAATLRMASKEKSSSSPPSAAQILCGDVCESWSAVRRYLQEVENCLECVDPHLCNNVGLVARLVDWEECWETGARYVQHSEMLTAICDVVSEIRAAQKYVPSLAAMCDDCDVGLFLFLPRMIWLRFVDKPERHSELLKSLLPHRFTNKDGRHCWEEPPLAAIVDEYRALRRSLKALKLDERESWELLVKRTVVGSEGMQDEYRSVFSAGADSESNQVAVEDLMRNLEGWSIELQRHCPDDWNQCCAILVQCLTETTNHKPRQGPFCV
mmetsp:Transcript_33626/g.78581  ORF Transcript_33626/g.78581 Transcript_33626/m.78581 type:complete len:525 (-) Transcript_33626:114-1688(-)